MEVAGHGAVCLVLRAAFAFEQFAGPFFRCHVVLIHYKCIYLKQDHVEEEKKVLRQSVHLVAHQRAINDLSTPPSWSPTHFHHPRNTLWIVIFMSQ